MTLSDYELLRLERIKRNAERLKALGLDKNPLQKKKVKPKKKKVVSKIQRVKPGQERRSRRLSSSNSKKNSLVMLDYSVEDGEEKAARQYNADGDYDDDNDDDDDDDDDESDDAIGHRNSTRSSRKFRIDLDEWKLSKKERESLAGSVDDNFLTKFQEFLEYHNRISVQNVRSVMRQARKLASGDGIRYEVCYVTELCYLLRNIIITYRRTIFPLSSYLILSSIFILFLSIILIKIPPK